MRIFGVITGTLLIVFMLLGTTYFWGMGLIFPKFHNPFFSTKKPWVILPWSLRTELETNKDAIVWMDVYRSNNYTLMVSPWEDSHIKQFDPVVSRHRPLLTELLESYKGRKIIINVLSNVDDIDRQLIEVTKPFQKNGNILFQSEYDVVLRSMKMTSANIPYGSSQSDRLRMKAFENLAPWKAGLLPATPFKGDVYFSPLKWRNIEMLSSEIVNEIKRRQKYVVIGPINNEEDLKRAQGLAPDGYLINDANLLRKFAFDQPKVAH